ncbi:hypothetical protein CRN84_17415 [Budvicia aquatica]|uniref:Uncharacterized protein n=1 Tax=Budvicia aquatica TaxID=82979 RepID=A0A2C6DQB1_9GAMM|nr:hypothetical protein CRN84_17415 [Budvicia aquatica]
MTKKFDPLYSHFSIGDAEASPLVIPDKARSQGFSSQTRTWPKGWIPFFNGMTKKFGPLYSRFTIGDAEASPLVIPAKARSQGFSSQTRTWPKGWIPFFNGWRQGYFFSLRSSGGGSTAKNVIDIRYMRISTLCLLMRFEI